MKIKINPETPRRSALYGAIILIGILLDQLLDQRFSHWMKELNITDLYLNESTSA